MIQLGKFKARKFQIACKKLHKNNLVLITNIGVIQEADKYLYLLIPSLKLDKVLYYFDELLHSLNDSDLSFSL